MRKVYEAVAIFKERINVTADARSGYFVKTYNKTAFNFQFTYLSAASVHSPIHINSNVVCDEKK